MKTHPRAPMSRAHRAKQFIPFAAITGLEAALAQQETQIRDRRILSEEAVSAIDAALRQLCPGDRIRVRFYDAGAYETAEGTVTALTPEAGRLELDGRRIRFSDILSIRF